MQAAPEMEVVHNSPVTNGITALATAGKPQGISKQKKKLKKIIILP